MATQLIDGRAIAVSIPDKLKARIAGLRGMTTPPALATVVIDDHPAAASYLKGITRGCQMIRLHAESDFTREGCRRHESPQRRAAPARGEYVLLIDRTRCEGIARARRM